MTAWASTGLKGLDEILCDLKKGDNVVWQVDSVEDYGQFVAPYIKKALEDNRNIIYMRFAKHDPLIEDHPEITVYNLDAKGGFESFSTQVHEIISKEGKEAYYLFDCLSDLLNAWATDLMVGNFFLITCPYLFELDTIAYFAILRHHHSFQTVARIRETTQLLLDVYDFDGNFYVHPLKVWKRYSHTMFLPHLQKGEEFTPLMSSIDASKLLSNISQKSSNGSSRVLDYWDRLFTKAEELKRSGEGSKETHNLIKELCRIMIGREKRIFELAQETFSLDDLINIKSRLIGSGFIGGKAAGMLVAQKKLTQDKNFDWNKYSEPHDSFYIGSDVFYSYIVENGWWKLLMKQKTKEGYFELADELKKNMLCGKFPDQIRERFQEIVEYFGQSPIIIRSSSLLEDSFGNAFAGKYESIFLANQGDPDHRYEQFEDTVRKVYASTLSEDALTYRLQRGLDQQDEQMALLVQRVSGSYKKNYFLPDLAGVAVSYNTFVWKSHLDPEAGMMRLVLGLGTRAVDRMDDDYPQTIALDDPLLRPHSEYDDVVRFSQHYVDLLDISENKLRTIDLHELLGTGAEIHLDLVATRDYKTARRIKEQGGKAKELWVLTFKKLLSETDFVKAIQTMLKTLESYYKYPVDTEFTANFDSKGNLKINLVQCRPLETKGLRANIEIPDNIAKERVLFESPGYTMGGSIAQSLKKIIYVNPAAYVALPITEKYDIARTVGKLNKTIKDKQEEPTILLGPGRWGTTTPSLGVPVSFSEINNVTVLAEIAYEGGNLMPELSFGTHFFQDLVESDIFYVALFPQKEKVVFNKKRLLEMQNLLTDILPEADKYKDVINVYQIDEEKLEIMCEILSRKVICFFS
ncbi:MAG: PEP/pyruvate-binding domain-containing protein [Sedimentisphaerales bacterium]|nr:PEP/pyruvate-binding domain-containing protein [Sedimentisphaerales bacterium]